LAYLGNRPAESFASFEKQVFTIVNSQTAYTLSHSVTNENDIRLVVNSVVQEPGSGKAYTASGTTLTLSAALVNGTDTMYCVFLGRALQTVNAPNASVGSDQTAPTIITGQTAETSIATDDTILIHDTSASALRKMTRANFVSGVGGNNTPYFYGALASDQVVSRGVDTKITGMTSNEIDTDTAFDGTTFTVPSGKGGNYFISATIQANFSSIGNDGERVRTMIYKNGSIIFRNVYYDQATDSREVPIITNAIVSLSASDTIELYVSARDGSGDNPTISSDQKGTHIFGFKMIG
jgi:hypothetical protein